MGLWTLDELAERVEAALADRPGQVNGRVRAVPDRRAIRWYTTIGLVDRPTELRGRTAMYSRRHLLQLVAIKRRQAEGHTLAEIQAELAGATDESLQPIAALRVHGPPHPASLHRGVESGPEEGDPGQLLARVPQPARTHFWTDRPQPGSTLPTSAPPTSAPPTYTPPTIGAGTSGPAAFATPTTGATTAPAAADPTAPGPAGAEVVAAIRLAEGVTVVLDQASGGTPDPRRLAAAAAPLLAELARQRLLPRPSGDQS